MLASTLVDAQVDLNPHQVDAALFAFQNPLSKGVILADEVGLGKTIEAGLVIAQRWAERKRRILIVVPANLRKQWHQELQDKFSLQALILETKNYNQLRKEGHKLPFDQSSRVIICSYQFAKSKADDLQRVPWDLVVMDEAHRLRNVYKPSNVIGKALKEALAHAPKVLLTATPLQNSLLELYGLVSIVDDRVFGDLSSFRDQFGALGNADTFAKLRNRMASVCKRTLRRQVQPYISYTKRIPLMQEFMLSAAMCKLEGFRYVPSEVLWWQQGRSSESDFIYVTTQTLGPEQLEALCDEVGTDPNNPRSLLVCCGAYRGVTAAQAAQRWPNLTLKKIPKMVKKRCEWGHDDYSLNVANLPMAQKVAEALPPQDDLFGGDAA